VRAPRPLVAGAVDDVFDGTAEAGMAERLISLLGRPMVESQRDLDR
jgi:hypothetical protein